MDNDEEEESCPLCMNALDETDLSFFACPCNYQVCLFCVHYIMEQMNGKCPACRQDYAENKFRYDAIGAQKFRERADKKKASEKDRTGQQRRDEKSREEQERDLRARHAEQLKQRKGRGGRRDLSEMRVVQRNVVHVIGLTPNMAKSEVLRRPEFFGQYGKLSRVTISKVPTQAKMAGNHQNTTPVHSAYLVFDRAEDAHVAIQAVDGFSVDGHILRANFGTTKYCRRYLEGEKCDRKDCNFLHKLVDENGFEKGSGKGGREKGGKAQSSSKGPPKAVFCAPADQRAPRPMPAANGAAEANDSEPGAEASHQRPFENRSPSGGGAGSRSRRANDWSSGSAAAPKAKSSSQRNAAEEVAAAAQEERSKGRSASSRAPGRNVPPVAAPQSPPEAQHAQAEAVSSNADIDAGGEQQSPGMGFSPPPGLLFGSVGVPSPQTRPFDDAPLGADACCADAGINDDAKGGAQHACVPPTAAPVDAPVPPSRPPTVVAPGPLSPSPSAPPTASGGKVAKLAGPLPIGPLPQGAPPVTAPPLPSPPSMRPPPVIAPTCQEPAVQPPAHAPVQPPPVQPPVQPPGRPPASPPVHPPAQPPVQPPAAAPDRPPMEAPARPPMQPPIQPPQKPPGQMPAQQQVIGLHAAGAQPRSPSPLEAFVVQPTQQNFASSTRAYQRQESPPMTVPESPRPLRGIGPLHQENPPPQPGGGEPLGAPPHSRPWLNEGMTPTPSLPGEDPAAFAVMECSPMEQSSSMHSRSAVSLHEGGILSAVVEPEQLVSGPPGLPGSSDPNAGAANAQLQAPSNATMATPPLATAPPLATVPPSAPPTAPPRVPAGLRSTTRRDHGPPPSAPPSSPPSLPPSIYTTHPTTSFAPVTPPPSHPPVNAAAPAALDPLLAAPASPMAPAVPELPPALSGNATTTSSTGGTGSPLGSSGAGYSLSAPMSPMGGPPPGLPGSLAAASAAPTTGMTVGSPLHRAAPAGYPEAPPPPTASQQSSTGALSAHQAGTPLSVSDLFGGLSVGAGKADSYCEKGAESPPPMDVAGFATAPSSEASARGAAAVPAAVATTASGMQAQAGVQPLHANNLLPHARRAYDVAYDRGSYDASRTAYAAEVAARGSYDAGAYDPAIFDGNSYNPSMFMGGYNPSMFGCGFDPALFGPGGLYDPGLFGADSSGLVRPPPHPFAQPSGGVPWAPTPGLSDATQAAFGHEVAAARLHAAAAAGFQAYPPGAPPPTSVPSGSSASPRQPAAPMAAAAAPGTSVAAATASAGGAGGKKRRDVAAGKGPDTSSSGTAGSVPVGGNGGSEDDGVEILQALFPNTRISIRHQQQPPMPMGSPLGGGLAGSMGNPNALAASAGAGFGGLIGALGNSGALAASVAAGFGGLPGGGAAMSTSLAAAASAAALSGGTHGGSVPGAAMAGTAMSELDAVAGGLPRHHGQPPPQWVPSLRDTTAPDSWNSLGAEALQRAHAACAARK